MPHKCFVDLNRLIEIRDTLHSLRNEVAMASVECRELEVLSNRLTDAWKEADFAMYMIKSNELK